MRRRARPVVTVLVLVAAALAGVVASNGWQIYRQHELDTRVIEWPAVMIWRCSCEGDQKTTCRPPADEGWYDPAYLCDMERSLPDYADTPTRSYRIRDLMGRKI
jgi:hypothetical protein